MNKQQLIEEANKLTENLPVLRAKDDEGNGYQWVSEVSIGYVHRADADSYEVDSVISEDEALEEYGALELSLDFVKVAVVY